MNSKKIMPVIIAVWALVVIFSLGGIGSAPPPQPPPPPIAAPPPPPPPPPAPVVVAPPLDELADFLPLKVGQREGDGVFKDLSGHYDKQGRYVLLIPFEGKLGEYKTRGNLSSAHVYYTDFFGKWRWKKESVRETEGPVGRVRLGAHKGYIRLSLNFRDHEVPAAVSSEVLSKDQTLALRFTFETKP